jgi:hypothetical protein
VSPITLPLPVWTWDGSEWTAPIGTSIRLVARPLTPARRRWQWDVQAFAPNRVVTYRSSSATHHERTAEAAQLAAWDALAKWLGAA